MGGGETYPTREFKSPPTRDRQELLSSAKDRWAELDRIVTHDKTEIEILWEVTMGEVQKGWLEGPLEFQDFDADKALPANRFIVRQGEKAQAH